MVIKRLFPLKENHDGPGETVRVYSSKWVTINSEKLLNMPASCLEILMYTITTKKLAKKQGRHSAYNLVISEYMRRVKISTEDGPYSVKKSPKRVKLTIDKGGYAVKEVTVSITRNGQTVNEGTAYRISGNNWVYSMPPNTAHGHPEMEHGDVMRVRVVDAFGNETIKRPFSKLVA